MAVTSVLDLKGKQVGDLTLNDEIFARAKDAKTSDNGQAIDTMHAALIRQLSNARVGSANTKTRAEVRGGGAKPWRQKGTGRARAGSRRSPLWAGGGVTFGPKPRDYSFSMPAKKRHSAIKSALSAQAENLVVINSFADLKEAKTKEAAKVLQALKLDDKKVLIVLEPQSEEAQRFGLSARNLKNVSIVRANNLGVKELLDCQAILTSQAAMEVITKWLVPVKKEKSTSGKKDSSAKAKDSKEHKEEHKKEEGKKVDAKAKEESKQATKTGAESASHSVLKTIASNSAQTTEKAQTKTSQNEKSAPAKKSEVDLPIKPKKGGSLGGPGQQKGKGK